MFRFDLYTALSGYSCSSYKKNPGLDDVDVLNS